MLPAGSTLTGVQVSTNNKTTFSGNYLIRPVQPPCVIGQKCDTIAPNPAIYSNNNPYPAEHIKVVADRYIYGYHVISIQICPFEYIPTNRELNLYQQLDIQIQYTQGNTPQTARSSQKIEKTNFDFIKAMVVNPQDLNVMRRPVIINLPIPSTETRKQVLHWQPDTTGDQPEYVIVTNDALKPYFQILADYKTKRGIPTLIATVEDIYQKYQGIDHPEQIRNYLKDVYNKWGEVYVLLGGDSNIVPARFWKDWYHSSLKVTDRYYSDLGNGDSSYNWNSNANSFFGETGSNSDNVSYNINNDIGRFPVSSSQQVINLIQKVQNYEKLANISDKNYVNNLLFVGAYHSYKSDTNNSPLGIIRENAIYDSLSYINKNKWMLLDDYETYKNTNPNVPQDRPGDTLSLAAFTNALNNGNQNGHFHFITHTDHGNPYAIGASAMKNSEIFTTVNADGLQNGNYYQIMYTGACEPGEFDKDSFVEHYVNNPQGGGVAILANSGPGFYYDHYQAPAFYRSLYVNNTLIGKAATQAINATNSFTSIMRLNFFGDPTMMVWTDTPGNIVLTAPQDFTVDNNSNNELTVHLNSISSDAVVTLYKFNNSTQNIEVYAAQEVPAFQTNAVFEIHPDTEGQLLITATAKNYLPATATTQIHLPQAHVYITHVNFTDSNGNNAIEPGEAIDLEFELTNSGNTDISNISAHLRPDDALLNQITVLQADNTYTGTIASGNSITLDNYQFQYDNTTGEMPHFLKFWLDITDSNGYSHSDEFYLDLVQTGIEKGTHFIKDNNNNYVEAPDMSLNQTYDFFIQLANTGEVNETGVTAVLSSTSVDIEIVQDACVYNTIDAHKQSLNNTPYRIKLINTPANQSIPLTLTVTNALGQTNTFVFDLFDAYPDIISGFHFTSTDRSITLLWEPLSNGSTLVDIKGYNIYRSTSLNGNYEKINDRIISGSSLYTDDAIDPSTTVYYYKISVVSSTNLEIPLDILLTNPADYNNGVAVQGYKAWLILPAHEGYPITHVTNTFMVGSPTVFDVNADGHKEVFTQAFNWQEADWYYDVDGRSYYDGGRIFAYDHQGHELFNIDGNTTNIEGFALTFHRIPSKLGIFDLDKDGHADVFAVDEATDIHAFKTIDTHNDSFDRPDHFWDYPNYDDQIIHYSNFTNNSPIIADVNNDGYAEIITLDKEQNLHIFDKDKQELYSYQIPANQANNVKFNFAVGDIDNNGYQNIIFMVPQNSNTNETELYSCQFNGNNFDTNLIKTLSNFTDYGDDWESYASMPVVLGDINNDNTLEIICYVKTGTTSYKLFALDQNGNTVGGWPVNGINLSDPKGLSIGQINSDDYLEIVVTENDAIKIFDYNGQTINTIQTNGILRDVPILADIDDDDDIEIIVNENNFLNAYDFDGSVLSGWGMTSISERFEGSPLISPLSDDENNSIIINDSYSTIYAWDTPGNANKIEWGSARYNAQNTACYSKLSDLDLTVKDGQDDTGLEPNTNTQNLWESTDIWIRNQDDGMTVTEHENPVYQFGQPVYVYVRVTNRSNVASTGQEQLKLYWGKGSTVMSWPDPWTGQYYEQGVQMGNEIGTQNIPVLQAGESRILKFTWNIPDPNLFAGIDDNIWHYCLLSRIEASYDPMTYPETTDLVANVRNNNNIAWKNVTVVTVLPNNPDLALTGTVAVGNLTNTNQMYYLELTKDDNESGNPIFEEAEVKIKMNDVLYEAWKRGGEIAQELESTNDEKKKIVKGDNVILDNLAFNPHELGTITLYFNFLTEKMTDKDKFTYRLIQHDYYTGKVIGGETFIIKKQPRPAFLADADDKEADKGEIVTLSATSINEAAEYNWYDMDGNLIYQGEDLSVTVDMAKKYKLEVIATADGFKDYKEVEVKLKPNRIEQLTPNPANDQVNVSYKINEGNDAYLMLINISGNSNSVGNYVIDVNDNQIDINLSNYPTGIYSVVLVTDGQITDVQELIIE